MAARADRAAATRARLVAAARHRFAAEGFAATGTEAILAEAGATRGALYHHYADKTALFEAVCRAVSDEAVDRIEAALAESEDPLDRLVAGSLAWIEFMTGPEARRILMLDAPTVLGWARWQALDRETGFASLRAGVAEARDHGTLRADLSAEAAAVMLNGALNALALRLGAGGAPGDATADAPGNAPGGARDLGDWRAAVRRLIEALAAPSPPVPSP
ncbi:MAG: TetR family transcriptional regulator [Alphaproteobacteria bacterium]|jgi:AcrR family transcriptional regulator|nr:TetR family transcriptional regulator [Alphaproteobacteria bacterium]